MACPTAVIVLQIEGKRHHSREQGGNISNSETSVVLLASSGKLRKRASLRAAQSAQPQLACARNLYDAAGRGLQHRSAASQARLQSDSQIFLQIIPRVGHVEKGEVACSAWATEVSAQTIIRVTVETLPGRAMQALLCWILQGLGMFRRGSRRWRLREDAEGRGLPGAFAAEALYCIDSLRPAITAHITERRFDSHAA